MVRSSKKTHLTPKTMFSNLCEWPEPFSLNNTWCRTPTKSGWNHIFEVDNTGRG